MIKTSYSIKFIGLVIGAISCSWIAYILYIDMDAFFQDQFPLLFSYDQLLQGNLGFSDIWAPKASHRFPGYQVLFFVNCYLFGFSPTLEIFIAITTFALAVFFIVRTMSLSFESQSKLVWGIIVASLILTLMNGQSIRLSSYSLIAMRLMNFAGFILVTFIAYNLVSTSRNNGTWLAWIGLIFACMVCILMFGRGWGMAATGALMAVTLVHRLSMSKWSNISLWVNTVGVLLVLSVTILVYFWGLDAQSGSGARAFDFGSIFSFYTTKQGSAVLGIFSNQFVKNVPLAKLVTAVYLFIGCGVSFWMIFRGKVVGKAEWVSLFLIYFSILAAIFVSVSRFDRLPFSPRHNMELSMGALGIIYWGYRIVGMIKPLHIRSVSLGCLSGLILIGTSNSIIEKYRTADSLKLNLSRMEYRQINVLTGPVTMPYTRDDFRRMGCTVPVIECQKAFEIINNRSLSPQLRDPLLIKRALQFEGEKSKR